MCTALLLFQSNILIPPDKEDQRVRIIQKKKHQYFKECIDPNYVLPSPPAMSSSPPATSSSPKSFSTSPSPRTSSTPSSSSYSSSSYPSSPPAATSSMSASNPPPLTAFTGFASLPLRSKLLVLLNVLFLFAHLAVLCGAVGTAIAGFFSVEMYVMSWKVVQGMGAALSLARAFQAHGVCKPLMLWIFFLPWCSRFLLKSLLVVFSAVSSIQQRIFISVFVRCGEFSCLAMSALPSWLALHLYAFALFSFCIEILLYFVVLFC